MKRVLPALLAAAILAGCGKKGAPGSPAAPSDADLVLATWQKWNAAAQAGDGSAAWSCLSKRSRAQRALLYQADAERLRALSGPALEAAVKSLGVPARPGMSAEALAAASLGAELRRKPIWSLNGKVEVKGDAAVLSFPGGPRAGFVREDGAWRLDDPSSR